MLDALQYFLVHLLFVVLLCYLRQQSLSSSGVFLRTAYTSFFSVSHNQQSCGVKSADLAGHFKFFVCGLALSPIDLLKCNVARLSCYELEHDHVDIR